jgi:anti-sigma regulatory factor (Ser/Thr protein kinase)
MIMPPSAAPVAEQLVELLTPHPDEVTITGSVELPDRPRFALVPATPVPDEEAAVAAAGFALEACDAARISEVRANLVGAAVAELSANALRHATDTQDPPVVAVAVSGRERTLEVAVTDLGRGISEANAPAELLRAVPGAKGGSGFLADLIRRGTARSLEVSIEMTAGTARLRWRWNHHRTETLAYVPGTTIVVRIPA